MTGWLYLLLTTPLRKAVSALVAVVIVVTGVCWFYLRENFHVVRENVVYRSAQPDREMLARYKKEHGIQSVLNLRGSWPDDEWYEQELQATKDLGLHYYELPLMTHRLTAMENLRKLIQIFDECPKPVLLHCRQGADRTSLAAAVYLLLYENKTPDEALEAYQLQYGHTGWAWGHHLPHLFDCYSQWLRETGSSHCPERFREWANQVDTVGYFSSRFEVVGLPEMSIGSPTELVLRVTNTSDYPWSLASSYEDGIHLLVKLLDRQGREICEVYGGGKPGTVKPGDSALFRVQLPAVDAPGEYHLRAELVDGYGIYFGEMGSSVWTKPVLLQKEPIASELTANQPTEPVTKPATSS